MLNYWGDTDFTRLEATSCTVNGYRGVFDFDLRNPQFDYEKDIDEAHKRGLKYVIGINFSSILNKWPEEVEGLASRGACAMTYDGEEAIQQGDGIVYCFSTNHPLWQETLIKQAKRIVDLNADGIAVIHPWGSSFYPSYGGRPDFSNASLDGFRAYLSKKYTNQQLSARGIGNLGIFNYLDYLHDRDISKGELESAPLYDDYQEFQRESALEFYKRFASEVKEYAKSKGINNFPIAPANHGDWLLPLMINSLPYSDFAFTNLTLEDVIESYDYHAFEYKLLYSAMKARPATTFMDASFGWLVQNSTRPEDMMQIRMAEAYANEGAFQDQYQAGLTEEGFIGYSIDAQAVSKVNSFYLKNKDLFSSNSRSLARVAVLLSAKSVTDAEAEHWSMFKKVCRILTASHHQYDVILSQDSSFAPNTLTLEKLKQYEVIILPQNNKLDNEAVSLIPEYLAKEGKLIIVNHVDPKLILPDGTACMAINWEPYLFKNGCERNKEFLDDMDNMLGKRVSKDTLPREVGIQIWQNDNKIVAHLVNYNFDLAQGVIEKQDIPISINLPSLEKPSSVKILSPDSEEEEITDYTFSGSELQFVVPQLKIWDILVIE
ncbi:MAG: hypothetical protein J7K77_03485 [Dehalococcoidales bacterium]|nr:hypothetical protein [Dehalococcoidales bacterium]